MMMRMFVVALAAIAMIGATTVPFARADDDPYGIDTTVCTLWQSGTTPSQIAAGIHNGPLHLPLVTAEQQTWTAILDHCQPY